MDRRRNGEPDTSAFSPRGSTRTAYSMVLASDGLSRMRAVTLTVYTAPTVSEPGGNATVRGSTVTNEANETGVMETEDAHASSAMAGSTSVLASSHRYSITRPASASAHGDAEPVAVSWTALLVPSTTRVPRSPSICRKGMALSSLRMTRLSWPASPNKLAAVSKNLRHQRPHPSQGRGTGEGRSLFASIA